MEIISDTDRKSKKSWELVVVIGLAAKPIRRKPVQELTIIRLVLYWFRINKEVW